MRKILSYLRNHYSIITKVAIFVFSIVFLAFVFPKEGKFQYEFSKGKPWMHKDLIAPFDFAILKSKQQIEQEKSLVTNNMKVYYSNETEVYQQRKSALKEEFEKKWNIKYSSDLRNKTKKETSKSVCVKLFDSIIKRGVIEADPGIEKKQEEYSIVVITNKVAEERKLKEFFTIRSADEFIRSEIDKYDNIDKNLVIAIVENNLFHNLKYDEATTNKEKQKLIDEISLTFGMIQANERIISTGELITDQKFQVLESLRLDYESKLGSSSKYAGILVGQVILLSVSLVSLFLFLYFFKKQIFAENKRIVLILFTILFMVLVTSIIVKYSLSYIYLVPVCLIPIVVGVFTDTRVALFSHLITIIITGMLVPNSYEFVFLQLFAGIVTILSIVKLERRSQFFLTSIMIFFTYSLIYTGMTLIKEGSLDGIKYFYFGLFAGSAVLTLFSYPVIYVFEKIFGFITDVTLLELSNTNNKILRELALKAPGTFQHSMQMANLAEEAIYEIGGNPLLVRTGAMYHDIGKIEEPLYFIENQSTGVNPHDELTYDESARIIIDHVIRGVEKAKKYKLPEQIIDFIRTHHGTRKTEYFYAMAKRANPDEDIAPDIYSYHGPEPYSKETAVLMMADTVEAASRSLKKPDEKAINELVESVIDKQMESKQFDNSNVTLRDIRNIKKIFKKKLMNIYHLRIEYPD